MATASIYYRDQGMTPDFVVINGDHAPIDMSGAPREGTLGGDYVTRSVDRACRTLGWQAMAGAPIVRQADGRGTIRIEPIGTTTDHAPDPDDPEYTIGKLRGALHLAQQSRNLWKSRAEAAGWTPETVCAGESSHGRPLNGDHSGCKHQNRDYGASTARDCRNLDHEHFPGDPVLATCTDNTQKSHYGASDPAEPVWDPIDDTNPRNYPKDSQHKSDSGPVPGRNWVGEPYPEDDRPAQAEAAAPCGKSDVHPEHPWGEYGDEYCDGVKVEITDWRDHPTIVRVSDDAATALNDLSAKLGIPADALATEWIRQAARGALRRYNHDTAPGWMAKGNRIIRFLPDGSALLGPEA